MRPGLPRLFGSTLTLLGAFAIGGVLHAVVVEQSMAPLSPVAVLGAVAGVALVFVGRRLERQFDPSTYVPDTDDDEDGEPSSELGGSPLDEVDLSARESDDSRDAR